MQTIVVPSLPIKKRVISNDNDTYIKKSELLDLLKNERECGEPDQSTHKLRGLYHIVLDGTPSNNSRARSNPPKPDNFPLSSDRIIDFAKSFSFLEIDEGPISKDFKSKRDLKESAKQ